VASPFPAVHPKDEMDLIRPARDGALRVLKAAKAAGVRRVVMTSSMAAIAYGHGDSRAEVSDETMWSNPDGPDNTPYTKSKTIAERAAWDYVNGEGKGLELAVINPTGILGPALSKDVSTSLEIPIRLGWASRSWTCAMWRPAMSRRWSCRRRPASVSSPPRVSSGSAIAQRSRARPSRPMTGKFPNAMCPTGR
jgi:nucleoside-diphosphate-sugar epimerase